VSDKNLIAPERWLYCDASQFVQWLNAGMLKPIDPLANTSNKGHLRWRHPRQRVVQYMEQRDAPATLRDMATSFRVSKIAVNRTVNCAVKDRKKRAAISEMILRGHYHDDICRAVPCSKHLVAKVVDEMGLGGQRFTSYACP